jgi:4-cresol dehydrogenase (hydroxylating) flavoprotein subunit
VYTDGLTLALQYWERLLGAEFVSVEETSLRAAETATFATTQRIRAILRPGTREQVQESLRIANRFDTPIYPISSGKNWGYGSRVPPIDGCTLLDLSRLDRIVDFSEELGYVTVEPGVTQKRLHQFLKDRGSRLWMDATGSSADCSLIGNAMERGFGHTPYGDHFSHVSGLEVVLPTGEVIETGSARFPQSLSAAVWRWGLGPSLDGLFSQSNLGVVTRMSISLMPAPEAFEAFFFRCESSDGLPQLVDAFRELRMHEVLRSCIHVGNDYKVLGGLRQYPWADTREQVPLKPELMANFRKKLSFGYWNASGGLYGTKRQVSDAKRSLKRALAGQVGSLKFLRARTLQAAKRFARPFRALTGWDISRTVELVEPVFGLMQGVPTEHFMASAYWRKRTPVPRDPDPDRDLCGLLWYSPIAPARGAQVADLTQIASQTLLSFGFEPMISLTMLTPRTVLCVISITYDRQTAGQDSQAKACYDELVRRCNRGGYYPYRLGIQSMYDVPSDSDSYRDLIRNLKRAVDPNGILAPGRYDAVEQLEPAHAANSG